MIKLILKQKFIILLLTLISGNCFSQDTKRFTRNNVNYELNFFSPIESFKNIYPVSNGKVFLKNDTIDLKSVHNKYYSGVSNFYEDKIKAYYLDAHHQSDSLTVILYFVYNRLFEVSVYAKGNYYLNNLKYDSRQIFKIKGNETYRNSSDSIQRYPNRIITYGVRQESLSWYGSGKGVSISYDENFITSEGRLVLTNKKIMKRIPSWCGNGINWQTWEKLEAYLKKKNTSP